MTSETAEPTVEKSAAAAIRTGTLRVELMDSCQRLHETVFSVTHDVTEAIQLSDRLLMLGNGEIYADLENPLDRPRQLDSDEFLEFRQKAIRTVHSIEDQ